jgi:hypothetical protein
VAFTFTFYEDAGLTTPKVGNLVVQQNADGSTPPVDNVLYLGSTDVARKIQDSIDPGVNNIFIDITDSAPASGHPDTEVKLALTLLGLDSAVGGVSLDLGVTEILGGVPGAVPIYIRVDDTTMVVGTSTELGIQTQDPVIEVAV